MEIEVDEFTFSTDNQEFIKGIVAIGGFEVEGGVSLYVRSDQAEEFLKTIKTQLGIDMNKEVQNCLSYALGFWKRHPNYRLWYNSDHVINLPEGSSATGFLKAEDFGYEYFRRWYDEELINEQELELLNKYFNK